MLYVESDGTIKLTRGDSASFSVSIEDQATHQPYVILATDVLKMTIKKSIKDTTATIQKTVTGSNSFKILPTDTSELDCGKYIYDVQLNTGTNNSDIYTVIEPSNFVLMQEVTD